MARFLNPISLAPALCGLKSAELSESVETLKNGAHPRSLLRGGLSSVVVDAMNRRILDLLMMDGKMTYNDVALKLRRSPSTIRDRIRRLEDDKVILGYVAVANNELIGMKVEGLVFANLENGLNMEKLKQLREIPGVMEVLEVSGRRRILIRLFSRDNRSLHEVIQRQITPLGLKDVEVRIVLDSVMRFPGV